MKKKSLSVPNKMQEKYDEISTIIQDFCIANLNDEYELLSCQLCAALCRKRPSPLEKGSSHTWACGIIHAIGSINFLFDLSQNPSMRAKDLFAHFSMSVSSGNTKSKQIRDLMKMTQFNVDWILPSKVADNPLIWMLEVDGYIMDIRRASKDLQEEAFRRGLIPYVPD